MSFRQQQVKRGGATLSCAVLLIWCIELSSVALGGRIVAVSDEFFAEAFHLLLVEVSCDFYVPQVEGLM